LNNFLTMDILAARKKAAEKAKAAKDETAEPALPLPEQREPEGPAAGFPPVPETAFVPEEPQSPPAPEQPMLSSASGIPESPAKPEEAAEAGRAAGGESREETETGREEEQEMLAFLLGSEEYVVPVERVQEVLMPREITPVPHTPAYVLGVCSLRGLVLPIIDLHRRLGLAGTAGDEKSRIVVVSLGPDDHVGLFVDRVRGVVRFLPSVVRPVPETLEQGAALLRGIVRKDDRLFILIDVERTAEIRQE
jgi:purine-binding chemotaxis protein CheW